MRRPDLIHALGAAGLAASLIAAPCLGRTLAGAPPGPQIRAAAAEGVEQARDGLVATGAIVSRDGDESLVLDVAPCSGKSKRIEFRRPFFVGELPSTWDCLDGNPPQVQVIQLRQRGRRSPR